MGSSSSVVAGFLMPENRIPQEVTAGLSKQYVAHFWLTFGSKYP